MASIPTNPYLGAQSWAYDRTKMLAGLAATQQCFTTSTAYGGLLPADLDGATAPPATEPNTPRTGSDDDACFMISPGHERLKEVAEPGQVVGSSDARR